MVDFPDPDGPTSDAISPLAIERSIPSSAVTLRFPSNVLETPRRRITTFYDATLPKPDVTIMS